jgi:8-oxo-dGTP pyrophosphatase MutT (NUDIX family)
VPLVGQCAVVQVTQPEPADSPRQACKRELSEELGIDLAVGTLLAVDWIPASSQGFAELIYVFDGGRHPARPEGPQAKNRAADAAITCRRAKNADHRA